MRKPQFRSNALAALLAAVVFATPAPAQPTADPTDLDMDGEPGVAEAPAVAYEQIPSVLAGVGNLLIDRSHGNNFDVTGFTDYLASQGWTIARHRFGPISEATLQGYDILMVPMRDSAGSLTPYSAAEIAAIQAFLANGGGLWNLFDSNDPTGTNTLSSVFGVEFQGDVMRDPTNNEGEVFWPTIYNLVTHPVTAGVDSFGYFAGSCLAVNPPSEVAARGDEDTYSYFCPAGTLPPVLATWEGAGRAVFVGDQTPTHPTYYPERLSAAEQLLLQNIANWLLGDPPNATSPASWGSLKRAHTPDTK